jgi:ribosomal-protein-alanine N-acetyltransferase
MTATLTLRTERLALTPFDQGDVTVLPALVGAREIADTTASIPHPYLPEHADAYVALAARELADGTGLHLGIRLLPDQPLIGGIALKAIDRRCLQAELGYWIAMDHWGLGYASEAARAVVRFGFDTLGLNRIYAHYLVRNPASGRVLERAGMRREGVLRQAVRKWDKLEDIVICAVLREDLG